MSLYNLDGPHGDEYVDERCLLEVSLSSSAWTPESGQVYRAHEDAYRSGSEHLRVFAYHSFLIGSTTPAKFTFILSIAV